MSILLFFILNLLFTCRPDLLLLDGKKSLFSAIGFVKFDLLNNAKLCTIFHHIEPTNMLDLKAVLWLEKYLLVSLMCVVFIN